MKTRFSFLFALLFCFSLNAQDAKPQLVSQDVTSATKDVVVTTPNVVATTPDADLGMSWNETTHDFGTVSLNVPQKAEFVVTNSGNEPLLITDVKSTCGCTGASASEGPVMPGESTIVTATYNAKRAGAFRKSVKVSTNRSESPIVLTVEGTVSE